MSKWRAFSFLKPKSLPQRISLPFIFIFLGIWTAGTVILGEYFALTLEARKQQKARELASLVQLDLERELEDLRRSSQLLSIKTEITDAVLQQDKVSLRQQVLPLRNAIEADYIAVLNDQGQSLLDTRSRVLRGLTVNDETFSDLLLAGADLSTAVTTEPDGPPMLLGGTALKDAQGIVGSLKLGIALDDELLAFLDKDIDGYLVALASSHTDHGAAAIDEHDHHNHGAAEPDEHGHADHGTAASDEHAHDDHNAAVGDGHDHHDHGAVASDGHDHGDHSAAESDEHDHGDHGTATSDEHNHAEHNAAEADELPPRTRVVAASGEIDEAWLNTLLGDFSEHYDHRHIGVHDHQAFIAQHVHVEALESNGIDLMLIIPKAPLNQAKRTLWLVVVGIAGAGCVVTTLFSIWMGKRLARPVLALTDVAQQVVQEKDFSLRTKVESDDELGLLADAFDQLVQWAGDYTQELERSAETLECKVEERTQELSSALVQLQDTQSQLIQTEKMSSLGQMVAGIAHEINNPISFIQGNLKPINEYIEDLIDLIETYETEYPKPTDAILEKRDEVDLEFLLEDTRKILGSLRMGTERVRDIVVSLRNYSRLDEATIKDVDIHEGINSTLLILNHRIKHGVEVVKDFGNLPLVRCSPSQLNQVFTNIIANALDAMFDGDSRPKRLTITTRTLPEKQVQISFRDTGPGMTPEIKAKIFDPFFTTKTVGKGTGMGMGICFKIIEQHEGSIEVVTEVGQGTELILTLPVDSSQPTAANALLAKA